MSVGEAIFRSIQARQVNHVFCVPGESYLGVMNAFYGSNSPVLVAARHEEGAGLMAEAYAKATNGTGVCFVTRGPGLTHLSIALHTAQQDSTPLVALVGQVPTGVRNREAFQELDIVAFARPVAKWALEIGRADRAAELMHKAFHVAAAGRPGPVVVSLPEDVDRAEVVSEPPRIAEAFAAAPSAAAVEMVAKLVGDARHPCIVAGGGVLRARATADLVGLAEAVGAPVYTAWRRFDAFPNQHPLYMGGLPFVPPDLLEPLREADLILAVGTRLGEFTTKNYSWPAAGQRLVHIDMSAEDSGGGFAGADVSIVADAGEALRALRQALGRGGDGQREQRSGQIARWRRHFETRTTPRAGAGKAVNGAVDLEAIYHDLGRLAPADATITSDAGTFGGWLMRYWRWTEPGTFIGPTAGGMGYAVPAAIGAKLARPHAPALAFAGDGGFAMTMSEIETAVRLGLSEFVVLVFNNSNYGTITRHQQRHFPGRTVATGLGTIDFAKAGEAMGAAGFSVRRNAGFAAAFQQALAAGRPAVIDITTSPDRLDPWED